MRIQYSSDTDILSIALNDNPVADTRDLGETAKVDLDWEGKVVSLTIEHAKAHVNINSFSFELLEKASNLSTHNTAH